jgi:hypothetical protein
MPPSLIGAFRVSEKSTPTVVIQVGMIAQSTIDSVLNLLAADRGTTQVEIDAARRFFASGCTLGQTRYVVEGGLLLPKAAAARLLGVSRPQFGKVADEVVEGRPRFAKHYIAGEKHARYSKLEIVDYATTTSVAPADADQVPIAV